MAPNNSQVLVPMLCDKCDRDFTFPLEQGLHFKGSIQFQCTHCGEGSEQPDGWFQPSPGEKGVIFSGGKFDWKKFHRLRDAARTAIRSGPEFTADDFLLLISGIDEETAAKLEGERNKGKHHLIFTLLIVLRIMAALAIGIGAAVGIKELLDDDVQEFVNQLPGDGDIEDQVEPFLNEIENTRPDLAPIIARLADEPFVREPFDRRKAQREQRAQWREFAMLKREHRKARIAAGHKA